MIKIFLPKIQKNTINGIVIEASFTCSSTNTSYLKTRISKDAGSNWSDYSSEETLTSTEWTPVSFGASNSTWGLTISDTEIKDTSNFYVGVAGYQNATKAYERVDYVRVIVYYTEAVPSASLSPSISPSISSSVSPSASISPSISASISPSPSPDWKGYTRGNYAELPADDTDLENTYTETDYTNASSDNNVWVEQPASGEYSIHQFKDYISVGNATFTWVGKSSLAPTTSAVYLQIYNQITTEWEQLDVNNSSSVDTNFTLTNSVADLANYKNGGVISCRVYQEAL
jgi:hypothetical protein